MGQITFKENGSIQFKGGKITFLSYPPMADPTVGVQWLYLAGEERYVARVRITNNNSYAAILKYTATVGTTVDTYNEILGPWEAFVDICYSEPESPDNGTTFKVEAFLEDASTSNPKPDSATVSKETIANFRTYIYNTGIGGMQGLSQGYTYGNAAYRSTTPTVDYLEVMAESTSLYPTIYNAVRTTVTHYMSTNDAMIFEYTARGSKDRDNFTFARASNWNQDVGAIFHLDKIIRHFSTTSEWTDGRVSIDYSSPESLYYIMQVSSIDQAYPGEVRIKKVYIESKEDGPLIQST